MGHFRQKYFDGAEKINDERALREADPSFFEKSKIAHASPQQRYSASVTGKFYKTDGINNQIF